MKEMINAVSEFAKNTKFNINVEKRDAVAIVFFALGFVYLITDRVLEHKEKSGIMSHSEDFIKIVDRETRGE